MGTQYEADSAPRPSNLQLDVYQDAFAELHVPFIKSKLTIGNLLNIKLRIATTSFESWSGVFQHVNNKLNIFTVRPATSTTLGTHQVTLEAYDDSSEVKSALKTYSVTVNVKSMTCSQTDLVADFETIRFPKLLDAYQPRIYLPKVAFKGPHSIGCPGDYSQTIVISTNPGQMTITNPAQSSSSRPYLDIADVKNGQQRAYTLEYKASFLP